MLPKLRSDLKRIFCQVHGELNECDFKTLKEILKFHDEFYCTFNPNETDEETLKERKKIKSKQNIIDWIMRTDPILADGGLIDFMKFVKEKNLIKK